MAYLNNEEFFENNMSNTKIIQEIRLPEDQLQRIENAVKSGPKKTIKGRLVDLLFGRMFMVACFAGYLAVSNGISLPDFNKVQREVLSYDQESGLIKLDNRGVVEKLLFEDGNFLINGEKVSDDYLKQLKYHIMLNKIGEPWPKDKGLW